MVEPDELDQISPGRSRTIDIGGFVDIAEVDPIFFDRTYYLGPKGKEYGKIFQLLTEALARSDRAGIALFSMRGKEYLTAVRADDGVLNFPTSGLWVRALICSVASRRCPGRGAALCRYRRGGAGEVDGPRRLADRGCSVSGAEPTRP